MDVCRPPPLPHLLPLRILCCRQTQIRALTKQLNMWVVLQRLRFSLDSLSLYFVNGCVSVHERMSFIRKQWRWGESRNCVDRAFGRPSVCRYALNHRGIKRTGITSWRRWSGWPPTSVWNDSLNGMWQGRLVIRNLTNDMFSKQSLYSDCVRHTKATKRPWDGERTGTDAVYKGRRSAGAFTDASYPHLRKTLESFVHRRESGYVPQ